MASFPDDEADADGAVRVRVDRVLRVVALDPRGAPVQQDGGRGSLYLVSLEGDHTLDDVLGRIWTQTLVKIQILVV